MNLQIRIATTEDVNIVAPLFDGYRMFYNQPSDLDGATNFINDRLEHNESVIFIALLNNQPVGFTQLYPIFTSVGMKRTWLLNDLFVQHEARGNGIASALLNAAKDFGRSTSSKWLMLETASDNLAAQALYKKNGWEKETDFFFTVQL